MARTDKVYARAEIDNSWLAYGGTMEFVIRAADDCVRLLARPYIESITPRAWHLKPKAAEYQEPDGAGRFLRQVERRFRGRRRWLDRIFRLLPRRIRTWMRNRAWQEVQAFGYKVVEHPPSLLETIQIQRAELERLGMEPAGIFLGPTSMQKLEREMATDWVYQIDFHGEYTLFGLPVKTLPWLAPGTVMVG